MISKQTEDKIVKHNTILCYFHTLRVLRIQSNSRTLPRKIKKAYLRRTEHLQIQWCNISGAANLTEKNIRLDGYTRFLIQLGSTNDG